MSLLILARSPLLTELLVNIFVLFKSTSLYYLAVLRQHSQLERELSRRIRVDLDNRSELDSIDTKLSRLFENCAHLKTRYTAHGYLHTAPVD